MTFPIPTEVIQADRVHHNILKRVAFSQYLNPTNPDQAHHAFLHGAQEPPFEYRPLSDANAILEELNAASPPRDHPAGELVGQCHDSTRLFVTALRDRTAEAFDQLAQASSWYPEASILKLTFPKATAVRQAPTFPATAVIEALTNALQQRGLHTWKVVPDPIMAARVLVDGAKRVLRVKPNALFSINDLTRLVVHEIDVHVWRSFNGQRQVLKCFTTGLPGALATEEGLAMVTEEHTGTASPGVLNRQLLVAKAIHMARQMGFSDLYRELIGQGASPGLAWGIGLRLKRGLSHPGEPGVYAKDSVYLTGRMRVRAWLNAGGDIGHLYVGKVGTHHPVDDWLNQGWVQPAPLPPSWMASTGS